MVMIDVRKLEVGDSFKCPITDIKQTVYKVDEENVYTIDDDGNKRSAMRK